MSDDIRTVINKALDTIRRQSYHGPNPPTPIHPDDAARYVALGVLAPHPTKPNHWVRNGAEWIGTTPIIEPIESIDRRIAHLRRKG